MLLSVTQSNTLDFFHSDHRSVRIDLGNSTNMLPNLMVNKIYYFKFKTCWLLEPNIYEMIVKGWSILDSDTTLQDHNKHCGAFSMIWIGNSIKRIPCQLARERNELSKLNNHRDLYFSAQRIQELEESIENFALQEELLWK